MFLSSIFCLWILCPCYHLQLIEHNCRLVFFNQFVFFFFALLLCSSLMKTSPPLWTSCLKYFSLYHTNFNDFFVLPLHIVIAPLPPIFHPLLHLSLSPFTTLSALPLISPQGKVAQTACMSACKHLSTSLMQMLLDTELKQISMGAIQQFNLDVIQCECEYKEAFFSHTHTHVVMPLFSFLLSFFFFFKCLPAQSLFLAFKETHFNWPLLTYDR